MEKESVIGEVVRTEQVCLILLDDYFKGEGYGTKGANNFTLDTPVASFRIDEVYNIVNQHQAITGANTDA